MRNKRVSLSHPLAGEIDLPLLVPSFTSKGFSFKNGISETTEALRDFIRFIDESYLISAYDIFHNNYLDSDISYDKTQLVFLDSGGYELIPEFDSTEPKITPRCTYKFTKKDYIDTMTELYSDHSSKPFVIANYDWDDQHKPFKEQIMSASEIFKDYGNWATNFILKPHTKSKKYIDIDKLIPDMDELRRFNIIGVTEKELGKDLLGRLKVLVRLRLELNRRNICAPIHVWGGLDPVITPLYYLAGADIFDGVSWLRYAFIDGVAVNRESYSVLKKSLEQSHEHSVAFSRNDNLKAILSIETNLRIINNAKNISFDVFGDKKDCIESAYKVMLARIPDMKEI